MPYIKVGRENSAALRLYYEDHGSGVPVVLLHGYPLSGTAWERQLPVLLDAGYRVITYDRRGFGGSCRAAGGYDYDTFAADLNIVLTMLDIREAALIGHGMGAGEIARYLGMYGSARIHAAILISGVAPYLRWAPDNPAGIEASVFERRLAAHRRDRYLFLHDFLGDFFDVDHPSGSVISDQFLRYASQVAASASPIATFKCLAAWGTDFRSDLASIDVPLLAIHGDRDRIIPVEHGGATIGQHVAGAHVVSVKDGPHGIAWTHAEQVNGELLSFLDRVS